METPLCPTAFRARVRIFARFSRLRALSRLGRELPEGLATLTASCRAWRASPTTRRSPWALTSERIARIWRMRKSPGSRGSQRTDTGCVSPTDSCGCTNLFDLNRPWILRIRQIGSWSSCLRALSHGLSKLSPRLSTLGLTRINRLTSSHDSERVSAPTGAHASVLTDCGPWVGSRSLRDRPPQGSSFGQNGRLSVEPPPTLVGWIERVAPLRRDRWFRRTLPAPDRRSSAGPFTPKPPVSEGNPHDPFQLLRRVEIIDPLEGCRGSCPGGPSVD